MNNAVHVVYRDKKGAKKTLKFDLTRSQQLLAEKMGLSHNDYIRAFSRLLLEEKLGISDKESIKLDLHITVNGEAI